MTPLIIAQTAQGQEIELLPAMANRHGLITGATGTGKTVSLQVLAEHFSQIGVPVFMADVKGDLSGISQSGTASEKFVQRLQKLHLPEPVYQSFPTVLWDVFGKQGHPLRATISNLGPLLLSRILSLNETQEGVLNIAFRIADDQNLPLLDLKDLRSMLQFMGQGSKKFALQYGNISAASIGAIQRSLLRLEQEGGNVFFGEPMLDVQDLLQTDKGQGLVHILAADQLMQTPMLYATVLLWLLSELYENLPEIGDPEKPKLVFFFDEAHLLFDQAPRVLLTKVEQVVRLIRSKGVSIFFITQNPTDIPDNVLGQLGNRVHHALRAFTARDQKAVKAAAETLRPNLAFNTVAAITELGVGEALISCLDAKGTPNIVERAFVMPPASRIGPASAQERQRLMATSLLAGIYDRAVDRESAHEILSARMAQTQAKLEAEKAEKAASKSRGRPKDSFLESVAKSAIRSASSSVGRSLVRSILSALLGKR